jgi:Immunoglobulin domain
MKSLVKPRGKANINCWFLAFWTVFFSAIFGFTPLAQAEQYDPAKSPTGNPTNGFLLNLDLGSDNGLGQGSQKEGFAAVGQTTNDFWNFYDADVSSTQTRASGTVTNLELANGIPTQVGVHVSDAPGVWGDNSTDPMYHIYVYPLDGGNDVVTFTNLPTGQYDVLAYSPDGNFDLAAGGTDYGVKTSADPNVSTIPVWTEGMQYARWRSVQVTNGQPLVLTVRDGALGGNAVLCGVQIISSSNAPAGPQITEQPTNETVLEGSEANFSVTASGSGLSYQWSFDTTNLVGATNATLTLTNVQLDQAGTYAVLVSNSIDSTLSSNAVLTVLTTNYPANGFLLNLDLGADNGLGQGSQKEGFAAVGLTTNDFWNFYDTDISQGVARHSGTVTNLELSDGTPTPIGVNISDGPGYWTDGSTDPMYHKYVYPLDSGSNVVTFTNLPTGQYDVLAYSPGSIFDLTAGTTDYGAKTSSDPNITTIPVWTEGVQYARWRNVAVTNGQPLALTVRTGSSGNALLCGIQIISTELIDVQLDHFSWAPLPSIGFVNTPIPVTIQAMNELDGVVSNFDGTVTLSSTNAIPIEPQQPVTFTNGLWTGFVTVSQPVTNLVLQADDLNGHSGVANAITIAPLPMLGLEVDENYLLIYWPTSSANFVLETSASFSPADWVPVTTQPFVFAGQNLEILLMDSTNQFYRLEYIAP